MHRCRVTAAGMVAARIPRGCAVAVAKPPIGQGVAMQPIVMALAALAAQIPDGALADASDASSTVPLLPASTSRQGADPPQATWYGLPALIADGASFAVAATGFGLKQGGIFLLGGAGYFLAAPVNHVLHGHNGAAAGSFLFRALSAGLAGALFIGVTQGCDSDAGPSCPYGKALAVSGVLLAGVAVLDDLRFARESPQVSRSAAVSVAPRLVITPTLGLLSFAGSF